MDRLVQTILVFVGLTCAIFMLDLFIDPAVALFRDSAYSFSMFRIPNIFAFALSGSLASSLLLAPFLLR